MKTLLTLLTCLFLLSPTVVMSETVKYEDLVERNGLYYQKSSDVPFTGETSGMLRGTLKKGMRDGLWETYDKDGQLFSKEHYRNGKPDGLWESYYKNGQLWFKGHNKDGNIDGLWEHYHENGQLYYKGYYKDGEPDGLWEFFFKDGTVNKDKTVTYKNGKKVSD